MDLEGRVAYGTGKECCMINKPDGCAHNYRASIRNTLETLQQLKIVKVLTTSRRQSYKRESKAGQEWKEGWGSQEGR